MTMLSIDWDFFLWRGCEAPSATLATNIGDVSAYHLFDWGHSEHQSPMLQDIIWVTRYAGFARLGLCPRTVPGFRDVTPESFCADLRRRGLGDDAVVLAADSHAAGYRVAAEHVLQKPARRRVVHFDAHHDLGYRGVYQQKRAGSTDCAAWLWHALDRKLVDEVLVVYPDWRDTCEWNELRKSQHMRRFRTQVSHMLWSDWVARAENLQDVSVINVARSSAWTPPWFDRDFEALLGLLPRSGFRCLDCADAKDGYHACTPRAWDERAAKVMAAASQVALTQLNERRVQR